jgi:hypothetical protein
LPDGKSVSNWGNVCGIFSPSFANNASLVKIPAGATVGSNPYSPCPYFPSEVTSGIDRFVHGSFTSGVRSPAFASSQIETGVPQPGNPPITSGPLPAANSVGSTWYQVAFVAA